MEGVVELWEEGRRKDGEGRREVEQGSDVQEDEGK